MTSRPLGLPPTSPLSAFNPFTAMQPPVFLVPRPKLPLIFISLFVCAIAIVALLWYDNVANHWSRYLMKLVRQSSRRNWKNNSKRLLKDEIFRSLIHRVKWRHRIYGHDTIAILWVWNAVLSGDKGQRSIVLFKWNSPSLFKEVSVWLLTYQQSLLNRYYCTKHFSELYQQDCAENQLA